MTKKNISYLLFVIALGYIISPWFFEKNLLFNEILSAAGLAILYYRRFKIANDPVTLCMIGLLCWSAFHMLVSLLRMDSLYYYLRNLVISYSMLTYFIGFYCLLYLPVFIRKIRGWLRWYIGLFLFIPVSRFLFERFGEAMLFPALFRKPLRRWVPWSLIVMNLIYGITYSSLTAWILAAFYLLLFISPGYAFFKQSVLLVCGVFLIVFICFIPDLSLVANRFSPYTFNGISDVMHSSRFLSIDPNSTWRLILWKQVLVDHFPLNIIGIGFGTPMFKYFPIEDYSKLSTLPYVLGAHNSYVYLFGRLGLPYVLCMVGAYLYLFKEYFYHKAYYYANKQILLFWSFFAATVIALFNPALESPIYAGAYWLLLGFTARAIYNRNHPMINTPHEDSLHP
jgi:hypothetical protein